MRQFIVEIAVDTPGDQHRAVVAHLSEVVRGGELMVSGEVSMFRLPVTAESVARAAVVASVLTRRVEPRSMNIRPAADVLPTGVTADLAAAL